jgi:hypothetical protein
MDALTIVIVAVIILLGLIIGGAVAFSRFNTKSTPALKPQPGNDYSPGAGDDGPGLVDPAQKTVETMGQPSGKLKFPNLPPGDLVGFGRDWLVHIMFLVRACSDY